MKKVLGKSIFSRVKNTKFKGHKLHIFFFAKNVRNIIFETVEKYIS